MSPFCELGDVCPAQLVLATYERLSQSGYPCETCGANARKGGSYLPAGCLRTT